MVGLMPSHHKHNGAPATRQYAYKVVTSTGLKKHDVDTVEEHLNALGNEGWDLVRIEMKDTGKGISFLGLMKRKLYRKHKHHNKH